MGSDIAFSTGNILANGLNNDSMKSKSLERVPTGSAREQAKVYPPARSTPSSRRIGVRLLQATDLVAREEFDPFAEVRVENTVTKSQAISKNAHPEWNDFLVFNVKNPEVAVLKVKLLDGMRCFKNVLLGEVQLAIKGFAMDPEGSRIPKWHVLTKKGKVAGKLMMQVYYVGVYVCFNQELIRTENRKLMESLSCRDGYDLVAVGVQECYYKVGPQNDGVGGVGQNKGGVAIALNVWDTELCFINSHLAAHQDKTPARNAMYRNIIRGLRLDPYNMDIVTGYHHIFWMGDLNYRIMFGQQGASPTDEDFGALIQLCYEKNINGLLELDQLRQQIAKKKAFDDFQEGQITFVPTYKMERKAGQIWDPMRLPAWCDRVLWKSLIPSKNVEVLDYYSVPEITSSDHKPVVGFYLVPTGASGCSS
ncbi:hypothetical protein BSKO_11385 [Bryopsis sp. KO-2023]|nr:hypothetical protein BSKO_11385 [Bryopsis sp. KO-2023]